MPLCAACQETKGFNKFHADQKRARQPVCKQCFRTGRTPVVIETDAEEIRKKPMTLDSFQLLSVIGQGAFGRVLLVRHKTTAQVHAMKIISKKFLVERESVLYMKAERDIMTKIRHPFVIHLEYAFQTDAKVYIVMEYQSGGELFSYLRREGTFSEVKARFYLAEMILALEHLHAKGIIHRDLKPENVLISAQGHVKLTDFGLAKEYREGDELLTVCGTKEYMAPEMLLGKGYDSAVDWWSLGALAHEMLTGHPPFRAKNAKDLQQQILTAKLQLPKWLSPEAHSLLKSLLERNVSKRLGGGKSTMFVVRGVQALKNHPFFKKIDWPAMEKLQVPPPLIPRVMGDTDTSNIDVKFTRMTPGDLLCDAVEAEIDDQFRGFSFYGFDSLVTASMATMSLHRRPSTEVKSPINSLVTTLVR
ncbi:hypothetical protein Poli38472_002082 [Pythium oligandrum]|uniref:Non-specific serine/threonine protein kinase n=1 Tax=Pythium oligandrum TaxID=41045 RepID=A0A8K1CGK8_PYTOL|nr:hypothetical protein Poli38472_002082 [Pythium oligandrum]|eukprot:TMW63141.1 hypothetical protein Poli38472_002082 [Pythium oligandrum]